MIGSISSIRGLRHPQARGIIAIVLVCLVLAFGLLGARGIWDPDEGRYSNVALNMLDSGNWLEPMRNEHTGHWTKPPLTYWLIAGSVAVFGESAWAARLPAALSYLFCVLLVWASARRLAPGSERIAAIVYATMLLPHGAGQLVTTDYPLAATQALALYGFILWRLRRPGEQPAPQGVLVMWCALGLGFLTKGPPGLLALLPIVAFLALAGARPLHGRWQLSGVALFLAIALPWYLVVSSRQAGLLDYFLGSEVVERISTDRFGRNGQWYGWLVVYAPTFLLGSLPWTADLLRWARGIGAAILRRPRRADASPGRAGDGEARLLLALWFVLPLLVFCLAQSRLPLYVLPLFVPVALGIALTRHARGAGLPRLRWIALWIVALLGLRLAVSFYPSQQDASRWAAEIERRAGGPVTEVVFVEDTARYGLHLQLAAEVERVARELEPQRRFNPTYDGLLLPEIEDASHEPGVVYITKVESWPDIDRAIAGYGYRASALGEPYRGRVIFRIVTPPRPVPGTRAPG